MENRPKKIERARPVSMREKEAMLAVLVRNREAFESFREVLTADSFGPLDVNLALVWQLTCDYFGQYEQLPSRGVLVALADAQLDDNPDLISDPEELSGLIDAIYDDEEWSRDLATSDVDRRWATDVAKRLLQERLAVDIQQSIKGEGRFVAQMPEFLMEKLSAAEQLGALSSETKDIELYSKDWDIKGGINIRTTNLEFLDCFMGGGDAPGEVYGVMGPFGSCKTTIAIMRAVEGAKTARFRHKSEDGCKRWGLSFFFSYEAPKSELRIRTLAYAGKIDRGRLEKMDSNGMRRLTTSKRLEDYEKKLFRHLVRAGREVLGERGRAAKVIPWLNDHLVAIDMTGTDPSHPGAGMGYVGEIRRIVAAELRRRKDWLLKRGIDAEPYVECIVVDYVGLMCKNHLAMQGINNADRVLRHYVSGAPGMFRNKVALTFKCPVYLIHQLSGEANRKSPGSRLDHTDAAEAKNFGENLDYCFVAGKPTTEKLFQLANSKHRRTGESDPLVLRLVGELGTVKTTGGRYRVDLRRGLIVEKDVQDSKSTVKDITGASKKAQHKQTGKAAEAAGLIAKKPKKKAAAAVDPDELDKSLPGIS